MSADKKLKAAEVLQIQRRCSDMILSVGGYWPPLAGSTRMLEELGELSEAFKQGTPASILEEAMDLLTITTAVANQYCVTVTSVDLRRAHSDVISNLKADDWIAVCAIYAGRFARNVLLLENIKNVKPDGSRPVLAADYAGLLTALNFLMVDLGAVMIAEAGKTIAAKAKRDSGRFRARFDPVAAPVLQRLRPLVVATHCPFAEEASLWGCPEQANGEEAESYLTRAAVTIERFVSVTRFQLIDGLILELPDSESIRNVEQLAARVNHTLRWIHAIGDPNGDLFDTVLTESWQFSAFGTELFVLALSDVYPPTSSRYTFGVGGSFLLLQPEISFQSVKLPRDETKKHVRDRIRSAFASAGRGYDGQIVNAPFEAPRYVKPEMGGDTPVRWWEL